MAIPKKIKEQCANDPRYSKCALTGLLNHVCGGRVTWEHALIYAGKQIQEKWAIVPLCEKAHAVNSFQDAGTMNKEVNVWLALNQGTEDDFERFPRAFPSYSEQKIRLNRKYGVPTLLSEVIEY